MTGENVRSQIKVVVSPDTDDHFPNKIAEVLEDVGNMLLAKNAAYGNSALDPIRIFSKADTNEQIRVRLDDKLSRLMRGADAGEDVTTDLLGYLVLLKVAEQ